MTNAFRHFLQGVVFLSSILFCTSGAAQQNRFVFIESEITQPFYVRIGETVYNSSSVGHLVIDGLKDSNYRFAIGFPHNQYKEQQFSVQLSGKDCGFYLKKTDAGTWVLYNWQTDETLRSPRTDSLLYGERKKDDGFASLMAAVVNDSAVLYTSIVKAETPARRPSAGPAAEKVMAQQDTAAIMVLADSVKSEKQTPDTTALVKNTESPDALRPDSVTKAIAFMDLPAHDASKLPVTKDSTASIAKLAEKTSAEEKKLVFLDNTIGIKKDTITVIIPLDKDTQALARQEASPEKPATDADPGIVRPQPVSDTLAATGNRRTAEEKEVNDETPVVDTALVMQASQGRQKETQKALTAERENTPDSPATAANDQDRVRDSAVVMQPSPNRQNEAAKSVITPQNMPDTLARASTDREKENRDDTTTDVGMARQPVRQQADTEMQADSTMAEAGRQPGQPGRDKKVPAAVMPPAISTSSDSATEEQEPEKTSGLVMVNSDCVKFATEHDVDKLRVKMLAQKVPGNRIFTANKAFRNMCFTTKQIRALSELFPDDELRFRFYETAWPFISDSSQFKTLEDTFTDPFFITRFRTLLKR